MKRKNKWIENNKNKKIKTVINKELILQTIRLFILNSDSFQKGFQHFRSETRNVKFKFKMEQAMSKKAFEKIFMPFVEDKEYQSYIIDSIIHSKLYREFISGMLYNSIRDFLIELNIISHKVPVAGRLIKAGQSVAFGKIKLKNSKKIETMIKAFIEKNLNVIEGYTTYFLKKTITPKNIENMANYIWENFKTHEMAVDYDFIPEDINDLTIQIFDGLIDSFLAKFGKKTISDFLPESYN